MKRRVYLAGPEVFLPNARAIGACRVICERHGLIGVFPGDEEGLCDRHQPPSEQGLAISRAMERAMRGCQAIIVNLTPFRGPSADVGSAYEMGFMRALGRPIFGYSNDEPPFLDRVIAFCGGAASLRSTGEHEDTDGMVIEPFACKTISCSPAASPGLVGASSPKLRRTPTAIRRSPLSSAASCTPPQRCCGSL